MPVPLIRAFGVLKLCAARVNARRGTLDPAFADVIEQAAGEAGDGRHDDQFPLVVWRTGSGNQTNLNANEVLAGRAHETLTAYRGGKRERKRVGTCKRW